MRSHFVIGALSILVTTACVTPTADADQKSDATKAVPKEVRALEGTYTGSWAMQGVDDKGDVVKRMAWTDTMKAVGAEVKGDRALVTTTDEMTFVDRCSSFGTQLRPLEGVLIKVQVLCGDAQLSEHGHDLRPMVDLMIEELKGKRFGSECHTDPGVISASDRFHPSRPVMLRSEPGARCGFQILPVSFQRGEVRIAF